MKCSEEFYKCAINLITNPKPPYSHHVTTGVRSGIIGLDCSPRQIIMAVSERLVAIAERMQTKTVVDQENLKNLSGSDGGLSKIDGRPRSRPPRNQ